MHAEISGILENYGLPIACPKCNAESRKTVQWFRENSEISEISCSCGTTIYLATDELIPIIERLIRPAPEG
jgi:hypothetical protein